MVGLNHCPSKDNWAGSAGSDAHIEAVPLNGHEGRELAMIPSEEQDIAVMFMPLDIV